MSVIQYKRTYTSGDKQTSTANQVIDFYRTDTTPNRNTSVQFLHFQTFGSQCHIKLNNEDTVHWIDADGELVITDINIDKITIVDAGVEYYYTAMSVE